MKCLFISCVLLAFSAAASTRELSIEIAEYGIYSGLHEYTIAEPNAPGSKVLMGGSRDLIKQTTTIPAILGVKFGVAFRVDNNRGKATPLTIVYHFPVMVNPETNEEISEFRADIKTMPQEPLSYMLWTFTESWELVSGKWTFRVYQDEIMVLEKDFIIVVPKPNERKRGRPMNYRIKDSMRGK